MSEWGPWVEHDGSQPHLPDGCVVQVNYIAGGIEPETGKQISLPNWYWRLRAVSRGALWWKETKLVPVCDDPAYAPIIRYRIRKPRGMAILQEIAEGVREPEAVE